MSILAQSLVLVSMCAVHSGGPGQPQDTAQLGKPKTPAKAVFSETPAQRQERLKWWREGRFGMFIHWGPVSLKGQEISWSRANTNPKCPNQGPIPAEECDNLYKRFDPVQFNADEWAGIAKSTGMKYVVLTAKHCDGFCLWPTKTIDYHIGNTPFKRDVVQELSSAVRQAGLKIGWYYSPMDWWDPDCRTERNAEYVRRMQGQLRELVSNYGRLDMLWFDWDGGEVPWDQENTYRLVRSAQPKIIIDNRLDCFFGGPQGDRDITPNADYYTPEQVIGTYDDKKPWETCMTLGTQWSWKPNDQIKSVKDVVGILARCVGGDGNLLLNVGPMPDGRIEPRQVEVLKGVGAWMSKFGASIYGTRGGPYKPGEWGASTRKGDTVYLHVLEWPEGPLVLRPLPKKVLGAKLLGGASVKFSQTKEGLAITVPTSIRNPNDTVIALKLDGPAETIPAMDTYSSSGSLAFKAKASASNVFHGEAQYGPDKALDDDPATRWATDGGTKSAWLEVDLGKEQTIARVRIKEAFPELRRVRKFAIEVKSGEEWKPCFTGTEVGKDFKASFPPVKARFVRLNVLESLDGPTIWEFQVFGR